jgi:hypothetical protein
MKHFYYAADWGFGAYAFVPNVLVSIGTMFKKKFTINRSMIPNSVKRLFLDSGGYSFFTKWGKYPFSVEEYVSFVNTIVNEFPVTEVAIMDYPCEPDVNRQNLKTNKERIDMTIQNALECIDYDPTLPWVPVVQGYTLQEYLYCIQEYKNAGLYDDDFHLWAIGSLCARKKIGGIRHIITNLSKVIKWPIHTFGMTITALRDAQIFFAIHSSDSGAWSFNARGYEKLGDLTRYNAKIEQLFDGFKYQTKFQEFVE